MSRIRLALCFDFLEEGWASMDLVGEMILRNLALHHGDAIAITQVRPAFRHRVSRLPGMHQRGFARNADRLLNRMQLYPSYVRRLAKRGEHDLFHIVDHSYSQLVHALPRDRAVVTCHDLDTFRCLLDPAKERRPRWFRAMTQRILDGMCKAAAIVCVSEVTRAQVLAHGLAPASRVHVVPNAIDEAMSPVADPEIDARVGRLLGPARPDGPPELLHVGTNIARKRIDVALRTLAAVRRVEPGARLIKVGGELDAEQTSLIASLGIGDAIVSVPFIPSQDPSARSVLAAIYRRATLVLQPSDAEGFGFPVVEAMACGTPVLASDIAVLREVGGDSATYAPVGDVPAWTDAALALLDERSHRAADWTRRRDAGIAHTARFRWQTHTDALMRIYRDVLANAGRAA